MSILLKWLSRTLICIFLVASVLAIVSYNLASRSLPKYNKTLIADEIDNIRKGSTVTCTIAEITENGLEVSVGDNLKGFIKKNDLSRERSDQKTDRYGIGDKVDATVTSIDKKQRKINLSMKAKELSLIHI